DPIEGLLVTHIECSRVFRWRLNQLLGDTPQSCLYHTYNNLAREHFIECFHMHRQLHMSFTVAAVLFFFLSQLPLKETKPL
ncbi:uncharacterized protein BX663DRAFT_439576, partial [Cokeromyces recurvatus]|uniref:uncharacterized protein n=1 Tax=Cokeromyces recurvatus TaxID=90255 RepID=UPI002220F479